ncbi:MAG: ATP-binding protein, partial [Bacteroidota bacterium]|nr:ATP-binding protein [Bacteroidota bacterium]
PLRKIHAFSDRLHGELVSQLSSTQEMMFQRIKSASSRMRQLIEDLLAYSQVSRKPQAFSPVDLNSVVEDALQNLEESIRASEARVHVSNLPVIRGDERQLQQLFQNLIGNAVKYRKPDVAPAVTISCYIEESTTSQLEPPADATGIRYYRIEVADNGIGFEQAYAEKIFEVFHRLHSRFEYEGTGIGLAIVQRVVHNHEGYIKAVGKPGEGATFTVWLPE